MYNCSHCWATEGVPSIRREGHREEIGIKLSPEVCGGRMGMRKDGWAFHSEEINKVGSHVDQEGSQAVSIKSPLRSHGEAQLDVGGPITEDTLHF